MCAIFFIAERALFGVCRKRRKERKERTYPTATQASGSRWAGTRPSEHKDSLSQRSCVTSNCGWHVFCGHIIWIIWGTQGIIEAYLLQVAQLNKSYTTKQSLRRQKWQKFRIVGVTFTSDSPLGFRKCVLRAYERCKICRIARRRFPSMRLLPWTSRKGTWENKREKRIWIVKYALL